MRHSVRFWVCVWMIERCQYCGRLGAHRYGCQAIPKTASEETVVGNAYEKLFQAIKQRTRLLWLTICDTSQLTTANRIQQIIRATLAVFSNVISIVIYAVILILFFKYCFTSFGSRFLQPHAIESLFNGVLHLGPFREGALVTGLMWVFFSGLVLFYCSLLFLHTALRFSRVIRSYRVFTIVGVIASVTAILSNVRQLFEATSVSGIFSGLFTLLKDALK